MLKTQRPTNSNRQSRSRVDFKISNLQALQVPKGWDRLFVTLIHVETGRTMAKLGKALVRNGSCQWIDTISESISITRDDSSKEYEECLVKLILSMGSTRSSILGEANINLGQFASSRVSSAVSQSLKKCIYGTILQLKIQCVIPRSKNGDEESKSSSFREKDRHLLNHEIDTNLYTSDNPSESTPRAADLAATSSPRKLDSKETSQTSPIESMEGSILGENLSTQRSFESEKCKFFGNQVEGIYDIASSKNLLEASERTAEAKMWERNARKLMVDLDLSRKELSDVSKKHSELTIELSAARAEHDSLNREVEKLKLELKKSSENQCTQDMIAKSENLSQMQKVLENEMKYQQDLNENIGHQLKISQESNIELVSVLQELEQTIEQQRIEIEKLSSLKKLEADFKLLEQVLRDKTDDLDNERRSNRENLLLLEKDFEFKLSAKEEEIASLEATLSGYVKGDHFEALDDNNENNSDLVRENEMLRGKIRELEKDCGELTDENLELLFKLKDLKKIAGIEKCSFDSNVCPSDESEASENKFRVSVKTEVEKNLEALERKKNELESDLSGMQEENVRLWENVSGLESQITRLKDECMKEREHSKSLAKSLKDDIEKLKRKSQDLESQLSRAQEECEYLKEENINLQNSNTKASREISHLIDDKAKLRDSLQEARSKTELIEDKLKAAVREYELKIEDLTGQLASSEQSHKNLVAEHENYKISEEKLKIELNELESNRTMSEHERQTIMKEMDTLKAQMQDEISILKDELERCKADKGKLEHSLKIVSNDSEEFEAENLLLREKISIFQDAISDFDECKRSTLVLQEKLRQVESAKETVSTKNEELNDELRNIKEENERFRMKVRRLEEENIESLKKSQALEEELKLMKERDNNNKLHKEGAKSRNSAGHKYNSVSSKKPSTNGEVVTKERYERTKSSLETELRELKERYLQMSLKYAEVESQREDLVMKLKASRGGRKWFT